MEPGIEILITGRGANTTVMLHKNQILTVSLPGNATTGYVGTYCHQQSP
jgi:predicted secreted protein